MRKSLEENLVFEGCQEGCSEVFILIKIQNTSISQKNRHIFDRAPTINSVRPLSTEQFFSSVEVLLSSTSQITW